MEGERGERMETEVYIDLYFLVNAGMDFLCLMISAAILHRQPKGWRCILGAILGGVYACMALLLVFTAAVTKLGVLPVVLSSKTGSHSPPTKRSHW